MIIGLQIVLAVVAIITASLILISIRKSNIQIEDSFFWLVFSIVLLGLSVVPSIFVWISDYIGFESPSNFIFLLIIFLLIINQYRLTKKLSLQSIKLTKLIQYIALSEKENRDNDFK
ncbi:DUF2304 domain-containing protein [Streptococcus marimammalium]|uniref:DUF2304 domain-containing protein n=1 Tax=Streptococcus marimammalium TaxID=269666 RepID=UPI0003762043|nr:DUF2304 domain-containing protein [Streptococcus marimammalium]